MEESNKKQTLEESVALLLSQNERTKAMLDGIATKADENFIKIEGRLGNVEGRLGNVEARLNSLSAETSTNFTEVDDQLGGIKAEMGDQLGGIKAELGDQLGGIKAELVKIGAATRYAQFHEDQKKFDIPE
jgi:hypothetical protein